MSPLLSDAEMESLVNEALQVGLHETMHLVGGVSIGEVVRVFNVQIERYQETLLEAKDEAEDVEDSEELQRLQRVQRDAAASIVALRNLRDDFKEAGGIQEGRKSGT